MFFRLLQIALLGVATLPAVYLVYRYGINVPLSDQWDLVATLNGWRQGQGTMSGLFALHNEHRMFFPKLVMLPLAVATGWDTRAEMVVSIGLAGASLWVALAMLRPIAVGAGPGLRLWLPLFAAAVMFSLRQWENWLWGWQIQWFLSLLGVLGCCALLGRTLTAANPWPWLAGSAAAAAVVHFSIASGVALWVAGLVVLACEPRSDRWKLALVWTLVGVVSSAAFFQGYVGNPDHPSPWKAFLVPVDLAKYVGGYLAGPVTAQPWQIGLGLAAFFLAASALTIAGAGTARPYLLPWIGVGLFGLGNAALTGLGRVGFGVAQGLASRYVTLSLTVSLAAIALGVFWFRRVRASRIRIAIGIFLMVPLSAGVIHGSWRSLPAAAAFSARMEVGRDCLLFHREAVDSCLTRLYPSTAVLRSRIPGLEAFGWSGFAAHRERTDAAPILTLIDGDAPTHWKVLPPTARSGWLDRVEATASVRAVGWAIHPGGNVGRERRVLVVSGDRVVGRGSPAMDRPDVSAAIPSADVGRPGWSVEIVDWMPNRGLPPLRAFLVVDDGVLMALHGNAR